MASPTLDDYSSKGHTPSGDLPLPMSPRSPPLRDAYQLRQTFGGATMVKARVGVLLCATLALKFLYEWRTESSILWGQSAHGNGRAQAEPCRLSDVENVARPDAAVPRWNAPMCARTLLIDWASFPDGFGSTVTSVLQAAYFAKTYNYTVLFSRQPNAYGRYLDNFTPSQLDCYDPEELHQPDFYRNADGSFARLKDAVESNHTRDMLMEPSRLIAGIQDVQAVNTFVQSAIYNFSNLDYLPDLDASRPLFPDSNVPRLFERAFEDFSAFTRQHFSFNPALEARVSAVRAELALDKKEGTRPTVGVHYRGSVHYRGGDKVRDECQPSSQISCGNITLHCLTAWYSLPVGVTLHPRDAFKPRLILMTTEADALDKFRADPVCSRFDVHAMPDSHDGADGIEQTKFNELPVATSLEDLQSMLAQAEIRANHFDAAIVSANSYLGRLILARGGPARAIETHAIRSVDIYWHPSHFAPFKKACDGTTYNCFPHDELRREA
ncbi:hypothetical protein JCM5296_004383 [Sporobolomyces johnsonii]